MKTAKLIPFHKRHTQNIPPLFPKDWHFDFEKFVNLHVQSHYFKGYTLLLNDTIIGFGNLFLFGNSAWLGNIVVDANFRGNGYGSLITKHLIEEGEKNGVKTYNLIATALGQPIYEKLDFKKELNYEFYSSSQSNFNFEIDQDITKAKEKDLEKILKLDHQITGENRQSLIKFYLLDTYILSDSSKEIKGFFIDGLETGSVLSVNERIGIELLKLKLDLGSTKVIIPGTNRSMMAFLKENKFEKKSELPKMILGKYYNWQPENVFNRGSGYCG